jgi:acyl carrier protein
VTREEIRSAVLEALAAVAPEADPASLDASAPLREQLDLDSMDFLNFVIGIHERTGAEIPEADYAKLASLEHAVAYVEARCAGGG